MRSTRLYRDDQATTSRLKCGVAFVVVVIGVIGVFVIEIVIVIPNSITKLPMRIRMGITRSPEFFHTPYHYPRLRINSGYN